MTAEAVRTNDVIRPVRHVPTGHVLDIGHDLPETEYKLLVSLHGQIGRGDNILKCESTGGDPWLYVYRHESGAFFARHWPGGGHHGGHAITPESDKHKRCKDYSANGFEMAGFPAAQEVRTNNRTRLDVATLTAPRISGVEAQISHLTIPDMKRRTTLSMRATAFTGDHARPLPDGVLPVWLHPFGMPSRWGYPVPSIAAQDTSWDVLPRPGTVAALGVRRIEAERCTPGSRWRDCPRTGRGWCRSTHPFAALRVGLSVDAVVAMVAAAQLIPLQYFTGTVYLVDPESSALYQELGGDGEYIAGAPATGNHKLGPCKNDGHFITEGCQSGGVAVVPDRPHTVPFPESPATQYKALRGEWLCIRCGSRVDADPCPSCGGWRITPAPVLSYHDEKVRKTRSRPGTCATAGCPARPPGGAEYCQKCRLLAKLHKDGTR